MTHGFSSTLTSSLEVAGSFISNVETRWKQGQYIPVATEAFGIYEFVKGSYLLGVGCKEWVKDYYRGTPPKNVTPQQSMIQSSKMMIIDAVYQMTFLPCIVVKSSYQWASTPVKVLYSACMKDKKS